MGEYFSMARRKGDKWYLASIANNSPQNLSVPLDFLDDNTNYNVTIYSDSDPSTILKRTTTMDELKLNNEIIDGCLSTSLRACGGEVCVFTIPTIPTNSHFLVADEKMRIYPNPCKSRAILSLEGIVSGEVDVKIFSSEGSIVYSEPKMLNNGEAALEIDYLSNGIYLIIASNGEQNFSQKLVVQK